MPSDLPDTFDNAVLETAPTGETGADRATPDAGKPDASAPADTPLSEMALQKVELDLDDAPFLDMDGEDSALTEVEAGNEELPFIEDEPLPAKSGLLRNKWFYIAAAVVLLLLTIPLKLLILDDKFVSKEHATLIEEASPEPPMAEHDVSMAPFWIEKIDEAGKVRFLHFKFAFASLAPDLVTEVGHKTFLIRDAIYYYLRNKDFAFLSDTNNIETVKKDVVSVLNQYLGNDQLQTIYIEKYLVK